MAILNVVTCAEGTVRVSLEYNESNLALARVIVINQAGAEWEIGPLVVRFGSRSWERSLAAGTQTFKIPKRLGFILATTLDDDELPGNETLGLNFQISGPEVRRRR